MEPTIQKTRKEIYMDNLTGKYTRNRKENCYIAFRKRVDKRRKSK